jgi:hypothetical protein
LSYCSPPKRAERAKLKSCKDDIMLAQGKRSAAPGWEPKMISSLFPLWLGASARQAREEKETLGWVAMYPGRWPRRPCPGLESSCPFGAPERRTGRASQRRQWTRLFAGRQWPGVAAPVVRDEAHRCEHVSLLTLPWQNAVRAAYPQLCERLQARVITAWSCCRRFSSSVAAGRAASFRTSRRANA